MSLSFSMIINALKTLKYTPNTFMHKNHEWMVEDTLRRLGLVRDTTQANHYIREPNGSQVPPDFRIVLNQTSLDIECKSSKSGYKPMWNGTFPSNDTLYLFTNKKDNETLLFKGGEIVTPQVEMLCNEYKKANRDLHEHYNNLLTQLSVSENPYGMRVYPRNMFVQSFHLDKNKKQEYLKDIVTKLV